MLQTVDAFVARALQAAVRDPDAARFNGKSLFLLFHDGEIVTTKAGGCWMRRKMYTTQPCDPRGRRVSPGEALELAFPERLGEHAYVAVDAAVTAEALRADLLAILVGRGEAPDTHLMDAREDDAPLVLRVRSELRSVVDELEGGSTLIIYSEPYRAVLRDWLVKAACGGVDAAVAWIDELAATDLSCSNMMQHVMASRLADMCHGRRQ